MIQYCVASSNTVGQSACFEQALELYGRLVCSSINSSNYCAEVKLWGMLSLILLQWANVF